MEDPYQPDEPEEECIINLGNEDSLLNFYKERFRCLQQIPCKSIAKDWIKVIEPKKQTLHPYNGGERARGVDRARVDVGELCRPEWWPPAGCRHREPDHITREERLVLLLHLLRNNWDPGAKSGWRSVGVDKLAASTAETVAAWSSQETYQGNRMILEGIYNVRRAEERFRNNETDANEDISCPPLPRVHHASRRSTAGDAKSPLKTRAAPDLGAPHARSGDPSFSATPHGAPSHTPLSAGGPPYDSWTPTKGAAATEDPPHQPHHQQQPLHQQQQWSAAPSRRVTPYGSIGSPSSGSEGRLASPHASSSTHPSSVSSSDAPVSSASASAAAAAATPALDAAALHSLAALTPGSKRSADMAGLDFQDWAPPGAGGAEYMHQQHQQQQQQQHQQHRHQQHQHQHQHQQQVFGGAAQAAQQWGWAGSPAEGGMAGLPALAVWADGQAPPPPPPPLRHGQFGIVGLQAAGGQSQGAGGLDAAAVVAAQGLHAPHTPGFGTVSVDTHMAGHWTM